MPPRRGPAGYELHCIRGPASPRSSVPAWQIPPLQMDVETKRGQGKRGNLGQLGPWGQGWGCGEIAGEGREKLAREE